MSWSRPAISVAMRRRNNLSASWHRCISQGRRQPASQPASHSRTAMHEAKKRSTGPIVHKVWQRGAPDEYPTDPLGLGEGFVPPRMANTWSTIRRGARFGRINYVQLTPAYARPGLSAFGPHGCVPGLTRTPSPERGFPAAAASNQPSAGAVGSPRAQ